MTVIPFRAPRATAGFTTDDLRAFARWNAGHYRLEIDEKPEAEPLGQFAMLYEGESCWASWAVGRECGAIVLWDCISLQTLGRFPTVWSALAAIPGAPPQSEAEPVAEVIPLRGFAVPPMAAPRPLAVALHQ